MKPPNTQIDFIIPGEGEKTLSELVQAIEQNKPVSKIKGLSFKHNDKVIHPRSLIKNLDQLQDTISWQSI